MKFSIFTFIACLLLFSITTNGQNTSGDIKVGMTALQGGNENMPEYMKIYQLQKSRAEIQWAYIEESPGVYDFSVMENALKAISDMNRKAIIKLNANRKPDWLFDVVPYTTAKLSGAIDDKKGTLMYWHPTFQNAYEKLLIAFGEFIKDSPYRDIITGIRMSYNALGVEQTSVGEQYWPLDKWIIPEGCDPSTVTAYTPDIPEKYKETVIQWHIDHILPYAFVWVRTNAPDAVLKKFESYFETGKLGFFHTGAAMEQNQVYFNDTHRYSRFIQYCRTGQTNGFTEADGYHIYTSKYKSNPSAIFKKTHFNYWRSLSEMHCGVSMPGTHEHMLNGTLEEGGPELNFFKVPEMDEGWKFADRYLGLHASPKESPGAWVALRDDKGDQYQGDYTFLMEREGNNPIAPLVDAYPGVNDGSVGKRKVGSELVRFGAWARGLPSGKTMTFHVDSRVFSEGESRIARVVYFDKGNGSWELKQGDAVKLRVINTGSSEWKETEVLIETDGDQYQISNTGEEEVIFHMLEVKRNLSTVSISVEGVRIEQDAIELETGSTNQLTATLLPTNASNKLLSWNSSDNSVASVNEYGFITAVAEGSATITVTTQDGGFTANCSVTVSRVLSDDASLSDLMVNGITVPEFSPSTFAYDIELSSGTVDVPLVAATTNDAKASSSIQNASALPGSSAVTVTAEDGTVQIYTVSFSVDTTSSIVDQEINNLKVYPNPVSSTLFIENNNTDKVMQVKLFNLNGQLMHLQQSTAKSIVIDMEKLQVKGMIMLQLVINEKVEMFKVIVQ